MIFFSPATLKRSATEIIPRPLPSLSLPIHYSSNVTLSERLTACLNKPRKQEIHLNIQVSHLVTDTLDCAADVTAFVTGQRMRVEHRWGFSDRSKPRPSATLSSANPTDLA